MWEKSIFVHSPIFIPNKSLLDTMLVRLLFERQVDDSYTVYRLIHKKMAVYYHYYFYVYIFI